MPVTTAAERPTSDLQRLQDLELLEEVARDITSTLDLETVLSLILDRVKTTLGVEAASVLLLDPTSDALVFRAASSANAELLLHRQIPAGKGIAGWVAQHDQPVIVVDPANDPRFYDEIDRLDGFVTRSILAVPLTVKGRLLGVLEALNKVDGRFEDTDLRLLVLVATGAAVALENARLYSELAQRARELEIRNAVSQVLSAATSLQGLLEGVTAHLTELTNSSTCMIVLDYPAQGIPRPMACRVNGRQVPPIEKHLSRLSGLLRQDASSTQPTILPDLVASGHLSPAEVAHAPARSLMILPLVVSEAPQGQVLLGHPQPGHFTQAHIDRAMPVVQQVALAVRKAQITEHLAEIVAERTSELRSEQARLRMIHEVGRVTVESLEPATLLRAAARQIREAFRYQRVRIWSGIPTGLSLVADAGGPAAAPSLYVPVTAESLPGWVGAHGKCLSISDVNSADAPVVPDGGVAIRSAAALPLMTQRELLGVLEVHSASPGAFADEDVSALEAIAGRLAMALKNARLFEQVAHSQREWEATFDSIAEGVVVHDDRLVVLRVNRALATMLDTTPEALVGGDVVEALCGTSSSEGDALRTTPTQPVAIDITDGRRGRTLAIGGYVIARTGADAGGRVLVVRDVTDERIWRARMLQTEKLASLGQLSAGIAHEINNPLGYIHSNLNTLSRYTSDLRTLFGTIRTAFDGDPRLGACEKGFDVDFLLQDFDLAVTESQEGVERVQNIVTGLKNFARADEGTEMKDVDLHHTLESALKIAWNEIKYKATVEKDYGTLPAVRCNPFRIGQVFINLLVNAAQAIVADGRITLRTRAADDWVEVSIQDTGHGVAPENLPRLFDPFFTTKEIGLGTGLGLSVVYGIVQEHGGQIDVASRPGQGTTFTIYLPVSGPDVPETAALEARTHGY